MTPAEYINLHGPAWKHFETSLAGQAFLRLIDDQHPMRSLVRQPDGNLLNGAVVFLNNAIGYERLQQLIKELGSPVQKDADDDSSKDFTHSEP